MREGDKTPLKERFEAASKEFATTFSRKARNARAGIETYSKSEFNEDLYAAASGHGLFVEALWAYFRTLHDPHRNDGSRKRFGENTPARPRGTGGVKRSEKALPVGVVASLLVALCVVAYGLYQTPEYETTAKVLVGQKPPPSECYHGICPIPNAPIKGFRRLRKPWLGRYPPRP